MQNIMLSTSLQVAILVYSVITFKGMQTVYAFLFDLPSCETLAGGVVNIKQRGISGVTLCFLHPFLKSLTPGFHICINICYYGFSEALVCVRKVATWLLPGTFLSCLTSGRKKNVKRREKEKKNPSEVLFCA